MVPLIARALTAGASAVAKRSAKKASEKAALKKSDDIAEEMEKYKVKNPNYSGDAPRRSPGYRDFETTSPRLSDEYKKGGPVKESKAMVGKELSFMKKKGAPKSMVKHEMMEAGMKPSRVKKFARGGGIESKGKTRGKMC